MLRFLNQRKRSQKLIWIIVSVIVVFGMVAFYSTPSRRLEGRLGTVSGSVNESDLIAKVDRKEITAQDYMSSLDAMLQAYQGILSRRGGEKVDYNTLKGMGLDKTLLDGLIRRKIVEMEVSRLGLEPTKEELQARIREQFSPDGKWIGFEKYKKYIERAGQTVEEFEESLRDVIAEEKLRSFVTGSIQVSQQEVQDLFNRENTNLNLVYAVVEPEKMKEKVTVIDQDLRTFFDSRKAEFRIDKKQRQVDYLFVSQDAVGKTLQITDDELRKDYTPEKYLAGIRVSQIALKVLTPKDDPTVKAKADELVSRARGTAGPQPEDFATLARGNSQDIATKDKGGDLGLLAKESIKPGSYLQRALQMQPNEVSDPIKDGNNYYILKVTERKNKTFEEAREALLASSRNRLSYKRTSEIADEAAKKFSETKDIKAVAADVAQKTGLKPEEVVRKTPFFAEGDDVPEIGSNPAFEEATGGLKNAGDIGVKVGIRGGFAIPQLVSTREPHDAEFDEVKTKVETRYKQEKAKELAAEQSRSILANSGGTADGLKAAIEKAGLTAKTKESFKEGVSLEDFPGNQQLVPTALGVKEGEVVKEPVSSNDSYLVFGVTKRTDPDMTKYNEQSKNIEARLLEERRQMTYESYVDNIKKKLKDEGKLVVYKETIDKIYASSSAKPEAGE
jgi:peptidyl-prolyl cis-trans isomerase D